MPCRQLSVIVVGGGIGGLTAAIALRRAGHKVTVYEKSSLSHEIGQGITIAPNGGRILRALGFDFEKARTVNYNRTNIVRTDTLDNMAPENDFRVYETNFGIRMKTAYRIDLHAELVRVACSETGEGEPVQIMTRFGVDVYDGDGGAVTFESGETAKADLMIAADGVKSMAAQHIVGPDCPEIDSSGTIVYRFTVARDRILADPLTKPLLDAGFGVCTFNVSPTGDKWLVRYWCRDDGLQNFALYALRTHEDAQKQEHALRFRTDKASLLNEMEGFHPALLRLSKMATNFLPLWRCTTREPLTKLHRGRMVVIGDAAHPVKPHFGMGAISAIEDAAVLGALFEDVPQSADLNRCIEQRLAIFDELRVGRVAAYKYYSDMPFFRNAVEEQREKCERFLKPAQLPAKQDDLRPWYMGFDVVEEAKHAMEKLLEVNGRP